MSLREKVRRPGVVKADVFRRGTVQLVGGLLTVRFLEIGYGLFFVGSLRFQHARCDVITSSDEQNIPKLTGSQTQEYLSLYRCII